MNTAKIRDLDLITICALRYAMGRTSYMPSVIQDFLRANWRAPWLQRQRENILRDLRKFNDEVRRYYPAEPIHHTWQDLYNDLMKDKHNGTDNR